MKNEDSFAKQLSWLTWLSWIAALVYAVVLYLNLKSLSIAMVIINTASQFLAQQKRLFLAPLLNLAIIVSMSYLFLAGLICVSSIGEIYVVDASVQDSSIELQALEKWTLALMCIIYVWVVSICLTINEFVVTFTGINWYITATLGEINGLRRDQCVSTGMWWSLRYHLGTLAIGASVEKVVYPL